MIAEILKMFRRFHATVNKNSFLNFRRVEKYVKTATNTIFWQNRRRKSILFLKTNRKSVSA